MPVGGRPPRHEEEPITLAPNDPDRWRDLAACAGSHADLFFPTRGEATGPAKAVCASCPVSEQCLADALAHGEKFGVWGGRSERERRAIRRRHRR